MLNIIDILFKFDRKLYNKKKKAEDKIKGEIRDVLHTCKTHNDFIKNICKILDKYFDTYGSDTIIDYMMDYSNQNYINIGFLNFKDNLGGTMFRIDTRLSRKTIENGASFDDLIIYYNPSHLKCMRGDNDGKEK